MPAEVAIDLIRGSLVLSLCLTEARVKLGAFQWGLTAVYRPLVADWIAAAFRSKVDAIKGCQYRLLAAKADLHYTGNKGTVA